MTPKEWDRHEDVWCSRCRYKRRCPAKKIMHRDPEDALCAALFRHGHCSQFDMPPKKPKKKG